MEWMPIEDAPKDGLPILILEASGFMHVCVYEDGSWWVRITKYSHFMPAHYPTHWMPLPPHPKNNTTQA